MKIVASIVLLVSVSACIYVFFRRKTTSGDKRNHIVGIVSVVLALMSVGALLFDTPDEPTISVLSDEDGVLYTVDISSSSHVDVYYNINSTEAPDSENKKYQETFTVAEGTTIRAIAIDRFGSKSKEATYRIQSTEQLTKEEQKEKLLQTAEWLYETEEYDKAAEIYQSESAKDDAVAMNNLGYLYAEDKIGAQHEKNIEKATTCYEKAFELGEAIAGHNLVAMRVAESEELSDMMKALEDGILIYDDVYSKSFIVEAMKKALEEEAVNEDEEVYLNTFLELSEEAKSYVISNIRFQINEEAEKETFEIMPQETVFTKYNFAGIDFIHNPDGTHDREYTFARCDYGFENQQYLEPIFIMAE